MGIQGFKVSLQNETFKFISFNMQNRIEGDRFRQWRTKNEICKTYHEILVQNSKTACAENDKL